jgi:hypothetical protein
MITYAQVHEWMAQANLLILFGVIGIIAVSLFLERKKKWVWHGNSMMIVMIITALLVVAHMGPSFVRVVTEALRGFDLVSTIGVIHGVIAVITLSVGVWLVWVWAINQSSETKFCATKKNLMWKILTLWLLSLGLGTLYYVLHIILS